MSEQTTTITSREIAMPFQFLCGGLTSTYSCRHTHKNKQSTLLPSAVIPKITLRYQPLPFWFLTQDQRWWIMRTEDQGSAKTRQAPTFLLYRSVHGGQLSCWNRKWTNCCRKIGKTLWCWESQQEANENVSLAVESKLKLSVRDFFYYFKNSHKLMTSFHNDVLFPSHCRFSANSIFTIDEEIKTTWFLFFYISIKPRTEWMKRFLLMTLAD